MIPINFSQTYPRLTPKQEEVLVQQSSEGDLEAQEKLFLHMVPLALWYVAKYRSYKYTSGASTYDDECQLAFLSLWKAVRTVKPGCGSKFKNFAIIVMQHDSMQDDDYKNRWWVPVYNPPLDHEGEPAIPQNLVDNTTPEEMASTHEYVEWLYRFLDELPERESMLIKEHWGMIPPQVHKTSRQARWELYKKAYKILIKKFEHHQIKY
jgi:RNA polymerase sigma factor (sigma-70 family)